MGTLTGPVRKKLDDVVVTLSARSSVGLLTAVSPSEQAIRAPKLRIRPRSGSTGGILLTCT